MESQRLEVTLRRTTRQLVRVAWYDVGIWVFCPSIEALRWAAMQDAKITAPAVVQQSFEEHNAQLYLAFGALVTVKNTKVNNELEAWRGSNATYDSNNNGRQRVRMQYLLQPKRDESIPQTTEAVERWECDVREYEQRFGKTLDEDVKIGVILPLAPFQVENHCHWNSHILKSYAQVRTMLLDYCRAQAGTAAGCCTFGSLDAG